jgi:hypothetical protein
LSGLLRREVHERARITTLVESAALYASGSRNRRTAGFARLVTIRNILMTAVARPGILLTRGGTVPGAAISGAGQRVCVAKVGRYIPTGTKTHLRER